MEPVKITEEEGRNIDLLSASVTALDEHVAIQIKARGELVNQLTGWWDEMREKYDLPYKTRYVYNRDDGCIRLVKEPGKKG